MDPRRRRVVWSPEAQADLDATLEFIAERSHQGAFQVLDAALETAASLATLSERGRVIPEFGESSYREVFIFRYRLMYRVVHDEVQIVAFIHGARDFQNL